VANLCGARGPTEKANRPARRKAELHYALDRRNGSVLLRQRNKQNSLMPGMWELPEIEGANESKLPLLKLRHAITTTDYIVFVHAGNNKKRPADRWVPLRSVYRLPLTGLTRKIIRGLGNV
jgi:A/G-specific adenine glycosylase